MDKQSFMFGLIKEWEVSGLSKKAFCRNHGIAPSKFFYWINKWKNTKEEAPDGFVKLSPDKADFFQSQYRLRYPNGVQLEVSGIGLGQLSALINL
jgi:transposase-like protein